MPENPFDGQELVDSYGVIWIYDSEFNCWRRSGSANTIPLASRATTGLLSAKDKAMLDSVAAKGGGFGIVAKPLRGPVSPNNPDGVVKGDIELVSDSIDIVPIDGNGQPIDVEKCKSIGIMPDNAPKPGFNLQVSERFVKSLCFEVPGNIGPRGKRGPKGKKGLPGTGDGPQGEQGNPGKDATVAHHFSGVKVIDSDDVYDTAVVSLDLDPDRGQLSVVKSKVRVPSNDTPADQVVATPIIRELQFTGNEFTYTIIKPTDDPIGTDDVNLLHYPQGFVPGGDVKETDVNASTLSTFVNSIIDYYRNELVKLSDKYDEQIKAFFEEKDDAARQQLNILAEELANCEFQLPIETCMGISPEDCGGGPPNTALAAFFFGDKYDDGAQAEDVGEYAVAPGVEVQVQWKEDGGQNFYSATLPQGDYVLQYVGGTVFDQVDSAVGYIVGSNVPGIGLEAYTETGGVPTTAKLAETTEPHDKYDSHSVEEAYLNGPLMEKVMLVSFGANGGSITLRCAVPSGTGTGTINVRVIRYSLKPCERVADCHPGTNP